MKNRKISIKAVTAIALGAAVVCIALVAVFVKLVLIPMLKPKPKPADLLKSALVKNNISTGEAWIELVDFMEDPGFEDHIYYYKFRLNGTKGDLTPDSMPDECEWNEIPVSQMMRELAIEKKNISFQEPDRTRTYRMLERNQNGAHGICVFYDSKNDVYYATVYD